MARTTAPKKTASTARVTRPVTRSRTNVADQRRFLAADIAAATLVGYRDGEAAAMARQALATPIIATLSTLSDQPIKILADGAHCAPGDTRTDHVAVLLPAAGILVHPVSLGTANGNPLPNHDACVTACRNLQVLGREDWELASRDDWNHILDLSRHDPAVDTNIFPGIKPRWHWTSTPAAGRSASAWGVGAGNGHVDGGHRGYDGFAVAVRRVGQ